MCARLFPANSTSQSFPRRFPLWPPHLPSGSPTPRTASPTSSPVGVTSRRSFRLRETCVTPEQFAEVFRGTQRGSGRRRRLVVETNDRRLVHIHGNERRHRHEYHAGERGRRCRRPDIGEGRSAGEWDPRRVRERRGERKNYHLPSMIRHRPPEAVSPPSTEEPANDNPSRRSKPILEPKASRQPTDRPCAHVQNQLSCSFQIRCGRSDRAIDAPADSRHSF